MKYKYTSKPSIYGNIGVSNVSQELADNQAKLLDANDCVNCYNCPRCINCVGCKNCYGCKNCIRCTNCVNCTEYKEQENCRINL